MPVLPSPNWKDFKLPIGNYSSDQCCNHDHQAKVAILFSIFKARMGTKATTSNPVQIHQRLNPMEDLSALESPFSKEEIDKVIHNMPADKSPGPDGFNGILFKKCNREVCIEKILRGTYPSQN